MSAPLKYPVAFPAFFLVLYGLIPVAVSAMYGGHPPPHITRLLDKQIETWSTVGQDHLRPDRTEHFRSSKYQQRQASMK